jgi:hypothetical protein
MAIDQLDQRDVSADLRMMDDKQLQQYAAMHKSDPYIFPLAFQESRNRQALRMGKTAQMAGQVAPKTNDAALMAMTPQPVMSGSGSPVQTGYGGQLQTAPPESQGISRLPAPNMQHMADGGIAGFDESSNAPITTQRLDNMGNTGGMFNYAQDGGGVMRMAGGGVPGYRGPTDDPEDDGSVVDEFKGVDDQIAANMEHQKMLGAFDDYSRAEPKPKKGSKADKKVEEPVKKTELPAITPYTPKSAEDIRKTADLMAKPELDEIQAGYKPFAEQFAQDRSRIEGREKNNLSDSLIRAGLGMMAGKSQFAMQNIGEGGLQGLNAYQEGQKATEASRRALTQSEMQMAQAQRAERMGARGDAVKLVHQAEQSQQMAAQFGQKADEIKNTKAYQEGSLLVQNRQADAAMVTAKAAQSRANALNTNAGAKGAMTEAQLARARDTARDNITKDDNYAWDKLQAQRAAEKAGKVFNPDAWLAGRVQQEVDRLLANTSRGAKIDTSAAPTGGTLGGGTYNLSGWGQPQVVTPNK